MKNTMKRRPYEAPNAELICLAPSAPVASWKWQDSDKRTWHTNSWSSLSEDLNLDLASVTGVGEWLDGLENPDLK